MTGSLPCSRMVRMRSVLSLSEMSSRCRPLPTWKASAGAPLSGGTTRCVW